MKILNLVRQLIPKGSSFHAPSAWRKFLVNQFYKRMLGAGFYSLLKT